MPALLATIALLGALLVGVSYGSRNHIRATTFATWLFVAILPLSLANVGDSWFRVAKTLSVLIPAAIVSSSRLGFAAGSKGFFARPWIYWFCYVVLTLNILEAAAAGATGGYWLNAGAGVVLCLTLPRPSDRWLIRSDPDRPDLIAKLGWPWVLLYTTWNICFVYSVMPEFFGMNVAVLAAPLFFAAVSRSADLWLQARLYTLGVYLLVKTFSELEVASTASLSSPRVASTWGAANLALHVAYLIWTVARPAPQPSA